MRACIEFTALTLLAIGVAAAQGTAPAKKPAAAPKATPGTAAAAPKFKAIWEPVPFNKDIDLTAIACSGPETCWVAGSKSTILFTADGGKTWQAQLGGDTEATDEDLADIFFLDAKNGWVMTQRNRIMGTTDGSTWAELSKVPGTSRGLTFLTPQIGLVADRSDSQSQTHLNRTEDGGRTWKRGTPCSVDGIIDGLPRKLGCMVQDIQFLSPTSGFMGSGSPINMGTDVATFSKTSDGGATWTHAVIPSTKHRVDRLHFWTDKDGLAVLASGQALWTADAGATWTGTVNAPAWHSVYASGEGKIIVGINTSGRQIGYSFNGGRSFTSRPLGVPAQVRAVTFPDARHGYFVGQHGMVYRYRIVPIDYSSSGMIGAAAP
jgi:photosystem II stability/assembly factor-like uncharacterized protein